MVNKLQLIKGDLVLKEISLSVGQYLHLTSKKDDLFLSAEEGPLLVDCSPKGDIIIRCVTTPSPLRINDHSVTRLLILHQTVFQIMDLTLRGLAVHSNPTETLRSTEELLQFLSQHSEKNEKSTLEELPPLTSKNDWKIDFVSSFDVSKIKIQKDPKPFFPVLPLINPVEMHFIEGIQMGECYYLGFAPRFAGGCSYDIELLDPDAPPLAFRLFQKNENLFVERLAQGVQINKKNFDLHTLKEGDILSVGSSLILWKYTK